MAKNINHLRTYGACKWINTLSDKSITWLLQAAFKAEMKTGGVTCHGHRKLYCLSGWNIPKFVWREVLTDQCKGLLEQYLGPKVKLREVQFIKMPTKCHRQDLHRDHGEGPRQLLAVAFSLERGISVGTHIVLGSVHTAKSVVYADEDAQKMHGDAIVFDAFAVHGGCSNETAKSVSRIFFYFESGDMDEDSLSFIKQSHGTNKTRSIPIACFCQ